VKCAALVLIPLAAIAVWSIEASWVFVALGRLDGQLDDPSIAWWDYAIAGPDGWTMLLLIISGAVPLLIVGTVIFGLRRMTRACRRFRRPLYGDSTWASDLDMRDGGIRSSGSPF
jgi:hypothetical protein